MGEALKQAWAFLRCDGRDAYSFRDRNDAQSIALWALGLSTALGLAVTSLIPEVPRWALVVGSLWAPVRVLLAATVLVLLLRIVDNDVGWERIRTAFLILCILGLSSGMLTLSLAVLSLTVGHVLWVLSVLVPLGVLAWTFLMYTRHLSAVLGSSSGQVFAVWLIMQVTSQAAQRLLAGVVGGG